MGKSKSIYDSTSTKFSTWGIIILGTILSFLAFFTPFIAPNTLVVSLPLIVLGFFNLRRVNRARKRDDIFLASKPQGRPSYFDGKNPDSPIKEKNS